MSPVPAKGAGLFVRSRPVEDGNREPDVPCCGQGLIKKAKAFPAEAVSASRQDDTSTTKRLIGKQGRTHETERFPQGHRYRRRRRSSARSTGHRAVDAGNQMAIHDELAEVARHALRRGRADGEDRRRDHRQQVSAADLCRRRNRPRPAGARRRAERHGRDGAYRVLLLFRQGPDLHLRHRGAVRSQLAPEPGLVHQWRRQGAAQRVLQELQRHLAACRQHRLPDGWLVPQGDQAPSTISRA